MSDDIQEAEYEIVEEANNVEPAVLDQQIATAKEYQRSVDSCLKEAKTLATHNQEVAQSCYYSLPRGGRQIRGPSIRLAEIFMYSWQNLRAEARIIQEKEREVTAQAMAFDLEKNSAVRKEVTRSIIDSDGKRYSDDMIRNTKNAAMSIALRNAIFSIVPQAYVDTVYKAAMKASTGEGTMEEKRDKLLGWFSEKDISENQVFEIIDANGKEDISEQDIIDLRGLANALKDGQVTLQEVFGDTESKHTADINKFINKNDGGNEDGDNGDTESTEPAKHLMEKHGLNEKLIEGTGENGKILKSDVKQFIKNANQQEEK